MKEIAKPHLLILWKDVQGDLYVWHVLARLYSNNYNFSCDKKKPFFHFNPF